MLKAFLMLGLSQCQNMELNTYYFISIHFVILHMSSIFIDSHLLAGPASLQQRIMLPLYMVGT